MQNRSGRPGRKAESVALERDSAETYNRFKEFEGRRYTGMKIGRRHKWHYDQGVWNEKKITPDKWEVNYSVTKRRAGKAPEGSGVPVGTHWSQIQVGSQARGQADVECQHQGSTKECSENSPADRR